MFSSVNKEYFIQYFFLLTASDGSQKQRGKKKMRKVNAGSGTPINGNYHDGIVFCLRRYCCFNFVVFL